LQIKYQPPLVDKSYLCPAKFQHVKQAGIDQNGENDPPDISFNRTKKPGSSGWLWFFTGLGFSILWPSAAVATKIGLQVAQPFVICIARFFIAAIIMLVITHLLMRKRLPQKNEWKQLAIYGLLNIALYLGLYVVAMQQISAGLGSLAVATNPVLINLMAALLFGHTIRWLTIVSLVLCMGGVLLAAWPLFQHSFATPMGITILLISMVVYSAGTIYFSKQNWSDLHVLTINGWQTFFGGLFMLPLAAFTFDKSKNLLNLKFAGSILWLAIPVSIVGVQLWLYLLKDNAVKASFWLFLCPVFGFLLAAAVMKEPIGLFTVLGMVLVMGGLYIVQKEKAA
jgi:probable blue pigment (indigoidine) exporter